MEKKTFSVQAHHNKKKINKFAMGKKKRKKKKKKVCVNSLQQKN
jgi:hypothetical protein